MNHGEIIFMGYVITDPTIVFTNFVMLGFFLYWAFQLKRFASQNERVRYWYYFFLAMSGSAFIGAIDHATRYYGDSLGTLFPKLAWICSALSVFFVEMSAIVLLTSEKWKKILSYLVIFQFLLFLVALFIHHHFMWVNINSAIGTIGILGGIHAMYYLRENQEASRLVWIGIMILPIILIVKGMELHLWIFNHHDLAHFILVGSLYFFFLAAKKEIKGYEE